MVNLKIDSALDRRPRTTFVVCKEKTYKSGKKGINIVCKYGFSTDEQTYDISEEEKEYILSQLKTNPKQGVALMLNSQIKGERILSYQKGTSYLLPTRFRRFYDKSIEFETEGSSIYFADNSIIHFSKLIEDLKQRNRTDTISFALDKIKSNEASHLMIAIRNSEVASERRSIFLDDDADLISLGPKNALYYSTDFGTQEEQMTDVDELLRTFTEVYGLFDFIKWNNEECVAYNTHSLKVSGIDNNSELLQKVLTYKKGGN